MVVASVKEAMGQKHIHFIIILITYGILLIILLLIRTVRHRQTQSDTEFQLRYSPRPSLPTTETNKNVMTKLITELFFSLSHDTRVRRANHLNFMLGFEPQFPAVLPAHSRA